MDDARVFIEKLNDWLQRYDGHRPPLDSRRKERQQAHTMAGKLTQEVAALDALHACV